MQQAVHTRNMEYYSKISWARTHARESSGISVA